MATLLDLPIELIRKIAVHLDAISYLAFTATCRTLNGAEYREDPIYWRQLLASNFRLPDNPVAHHHGTRYYDLYRRLRTQLRIFTWGHNRNHQLHRPTGPGPSSLNPLPTKEGALSSHPGIVCDVQASGWGTCFLNSQGHIHAVGTLNDEDFSQSSNTQLSRLCFPRDPASRDYPHVSREEQSPHFAVRSFSAGRSRIVALSDDDTIWQWRDFRRPAIDVSARLADQMPQTCGRVEAVVAGWHTNAALIKHVGIVVWSTKRARQAPPGTIVYAIVPGTAQMTVGRDDSADVIESVVLLESFVLYSTKAGRLWAAKTATFDPSGLNMTISAPFEVRLAATTVGPSRTHTRDETVTPSKVIHIQGHFKRFAIFTSVDGVLIGNSQELASISSGTSDILDTLIIPALQKTMTISIAFGDHHFLALHADGTVTSYGSECQGCGNLGFGPPSIAALRGVVDSPPVAGLAPDWQPGRDDGRLHESAYETGRQVWFDRPRRKWLQWLAHELRPMLEDRQLPYDELYEWIEQKGRDFPGIFGKSDTQAGTASPSPDEGRKEHFALAITASGWHSCALVLEDPAAMRRVEQECSISLSWGDKADWPVILEGDKGDNLRALLRAAGCMINSDGTISTVLDVWPNIGQRGLAPDQEHVYTWFDKTARDLMPMAGWTRRERRLSFRDVI